MDTRGHSFWTGPVMLSGPPGPDDARGQPEEQVHIEPVDFLAISACGRSVEDDPLAVDHDVADNHRRPLLDHR
jgi:hypothetical protein